MDVQLTDPVYFEKAKRNVLESFFEKFLNNKRDVPFIFLSIKITCIIVPFALYLFLNKNVHWAFYLIYLALIFIFFLGPFILMLHNTCHRKLFKKQYSYLIKYIHWFLGGFFGQTPETYFYHHIAMHHAENNLEEDLSSTMKYRRDSIRGFSNYLISFYFRGVLDLASYFRIRNRKKFSVQILAGECVYFTVIILLCFYNLKATVVVYLLPLIFTRFAMMAGNWAQHAFIDPEYPDNIYRNSITCINTIYNKQCFNDGYHIGHHLRPALHWTEMPSNFLENIEEYKRNDVIVFTGLDYFQIWFLLMTKNYQFLSKRFVPLNDKYATQAEIENFLKSRTRAIYS